MATLNNLDQLINDEGPETVAAFFAEPIMGAGGVITPPKNVLRALKDSSDVERTKAAPIVTILQHPLARKGS